MKRNTQLGMELLAALHSHGDMPQTELAKLSGLSQPTLSAIISRPSRISPENLKKITHCWNSKTNIHLLIAHLHDEIIRAGHATRCIDIRPRNGAINMPIAHEDIELIREHLKDKTIRTLIESLANMIRRSEEAANNNEWPAAAAEQPDDGYLKSPVDKPAPAPQNKKPAKPKE